jgi:hypothetical protein
MPIYVHLIEHPDGRVLVDTGLTELHPAVADMDPRLLPLDQQAARGARDGGLDVARARRMEPRKSRWFRAIGRGRLPANAVATR